MELLILRLKQAHLHKGDGLQRNSLWVNLYNLYKELVLLE